jgi:hypothetical protein
LTKGCAQIFDTTMRNLRCNHIQLDEIWEFITKKRRNVQLGEQDVGDIGTFVAIDAKSKAVPCFNVGQRDAAVRASIVSDSKSPPV